MDSEKMPENATIYGLYYDYYDYYNNLLIGYGKSGVTFLTLNLIQGVAIVVLNGMCLVCIVRKHLYRQDNKFIFLTCLSSSDFLTGLVLLVQGPFLYLDSFYGKDNDLIVQISLATLLFSSASSVYSLLFLTLDQFLKIQLPLRYPAYGRRRNALIAVGVIYFVGVSDTVAFFFVWDMSNPGSNWVHYYDMVLLCLLPLSFILMMHLRIFWISRRQRRQIAAHRVAPTVPTVLATLGGEDGRSGGLGGERSGRVDGGGHMSHGGHMTHIERSTHVHEPLSQGSTGTAHEHTTNMTTMRSAAQLTDRGTDRPGAVIRPRPPRRSIRRTGQRSGTGSSDSVMRVTRTIAVLVGVLVITWVPSSLFFVMSNSRPEIRTKNRTVFTWIDESLTLVYFCNSLVNPLVYVLRIPEIKGQFLKLIKRR